MESLNQVFEKNKSMFKLIFNVDWDKQPDLYLQYVQTLYIYEISAQLSEGINKIFINQNQIISNLIK